jgi:amidohydrolase
VTAVSAVPVDEAVLLPALEFYLDVHGEPELSGAEERTAALFAASLKSLGIPVTTQVGGHGVVGVLRNGDGPTVLLRAELDALPLVEDTAMPYASTNGAMHACGHDLHLACLLGAATVLAADRDAWSGTVLLVGQPAEETLTGAAAMLADGLYDRFGRPDLLLAQHLAPFPAHRVAHGSAMLAAARMLRIVFPGLGGHVGGHGGYPRTPPNPIDDVARLVTGLRELRTDATATPGMIAGGAVPNVVPDAATVELSVRSADSATADDAVAEVIALAESVGQTEKPEITVLSRAEATVNDPEWTQRIRAAHASALGGAGAVLPWQTSMATEDFPLFSEGGAIPLVYWMLGCVDPSVLAGTPEEVGAALAAVPANHSPRFIPAVAPTLRTGITALVSAAKAGLLTTAVRQV